MEISYIEPNSSKENLFEASQQVAWLAAGLIASVAVVYWFINTGVTVF
jgi:hypothetical protein